MYIVSYNVKDTYACFATRNLWGRIFPTIFNCYINMAVMRIPPYKECYKKRGKIFLKKGEKKT